MDLRQYIESIQRQVEAAADAGGDEARALAERLATPLEPGIRLTLQDLLSAAAEEITCDLAPGSVELRLRGREPEFVVNTPPAEAPAGGTTAAPAAPLPPIDSDDPATARINLRMPDLLKARVEAAASAEGVSVNSWLVRAASVALERAGPHPPGSGPDPAPTWKGSKYRGWAR